MRALPFDIVADAASQELLAASFEKCSGYHLVRGQDALIEPVAYEEGAIVPHRTWIQSSLDVKSRPTEGRPFIALVDAREAVRVLWQLDIINEHNVRQAASNQALELWYNEVFEPYLVERWGVLDGVQLIGGYSNEPDMDTSTISHQSKLRLGIHIDTWEGWSWSDRAKAKYRLCMNIGFRDRFFIFGSKTASEISIQTTDDFNVNGKVVKGGTRDFREKIAENDIEFYRIRTPPGFGYIAPTDLVFHDGSTLGIDGPTAQFTVRAYFQHSLSSWD